LRTFTSEDNLALLSEIVITDGGSTDGTWEMLDGWSDKVEKLKVHKIPGANISRGRNEAVKRTNAEIIVTFDSGTGYIDGWLKKMIEPFENEGAEVVGGLTIFKGRTLFEKCMASFRDDKRVAIQPSHRGCAFKKKVWEKIGGYPEHVEAGEDTWFNSQWRKLGFKYVHVPEAEQYWTVRSDWKSVFKMARRNTKGHVALGEMSGTMTVAAITGLNILCAVLFVLGFFRHYLWLVAIGLYALNLIRRMSEKGRWRSFVNPVNIVVGSYALSAFDLGMTLGAIEGFGLLIKHKMLNGRTRGYV